MKTIYKQQAEQFLTDTKTTLEIVKAIPQKKPLWCKDGEKHGINYWVTLKNDRHSYSFNYWGSIADAEKDTKPTAYSILACLSYTPSENFEDFCDNFGYETDSITALKTFEAVQEQEKNLEKLFTVAELTKMAEIQ